MPPDSIPATPGSSVGSSVGSSSAPSEILTPETSQGAPSPSPDPERPKWELSATDTDLSASELELTAPGSVIGHGALEEAFPWPDSCSETTMLLQPATRPISQEQLVNEVKGIYAGLVMVEKKCVEICQQQAQTTNKLSNEQWQALINLHRTLLHEHHDFFLA